MCSVYKYEDSGRGEPWMVAAGCNQARARLGNLQSGKRMPGVAGQITSYVGLCAPPSLHCHLLCTLYVL
jgi:hypothetical protein